MIRTIKLIFSYVSYYALFKFINRTNFNFIINNLRTNLMILPLNRVWNLFIEVVWNRITENSILNNITSKINPALESANTLLDTPFKRLFLSGFIFFILVYRSYIILKRLIIWPFKLGIFSFLYSIIGFYLTWFFKLFSYFPLNIPHWVYFQYILLYNNWLTWWYNNVSIKSLQTPRVINNINKIKSNKNLLKRDDLDIISDKIENKSNKKLLITITVITILGVFGVLYYYDLLPYFGGSKPPSPPTSDSSSSSSEYISNEELINIRNNQTQAPNSQQFSTTSYVEPSTSSSTSRNSSSVDVVQQINNAWETRDSSSRTSSNSSSPTHINPRVQADRDHLFQYPEEASAWDSSTTLESTNKSLSPTTSEAGWSSPTRSPSPTGSTDSSETVKNYPTRGNS